MVKNNGNRPKKGWFPLGLKKEQAKKDNE